MPSCGRTCAREIRQLQRQLGITMVYVTHDQIEAMSMADRVVLLNGGKIEQDRRAGRALRGPGQHLRCALHRHAADEPAAARGGPRRRGHRRDRAVRRWRPRPAPDSPWACGPSTSRSATSAGSPPRSRASSTSAPTRSSRAGSGTATLTVRVAGSVGLARGDAGLAVVGAGRAAPVRSRRHAARGIVVDDEPATLFA